jgi:hypothetical protein
MPPLFLFNLNEGIAMKLTIDGQQRLFTPLATFQAEWDLPAEFGITYFESKDWPVGTVESAGRALGEIKGAILQAVPSALTRAELLRQPQLLAATFREQLKGANPHIGLTAEQLDFAVDGLQNVLVGVAYHLIQAVQNTKQEQNTFDFENLYQTWLNESVQLFSKVYTYQQGHRRFEIRMVNYVYGRVGMRIEVEGRVYYVLDMSLACPAWGYMGELCREVAQALSEAFLPQGSSK